MAQLIVKERANSIDNSLAVDKANVIANSRANAIAYVKVNGIGFPNKPKTRMGDGDGNCAFLP